MEVKVSVAVNCPLHTVCAVGVTVMIGVGATDIVNVCTGPTQLLAVGVTVNTPLIIVEPELVAVNDGINAPLPLDNTPIAGLLLFQV